MTPEELAYFAGIMYSFAIASKVEPFEISFRRSVVNFKENGWIIKLTVIRAKKALGLAHDIDGFELASHPDPRQLGLMHIRHMLGRFEGR